LLEDVFAFDTDGGRGIIQSSAFRDPTEGGLINHFKTNYSLARNSFFFAHILAQASLARLWPNTKPDQK